MDAQLLQALGHVGGHVLECIPGQVETLQLGQGAEGLVVDDADLVVHQDQSLWKGQGEKVLLLHTFDPRCLRVMDGQLQFFHQTSLFLFKGLLDFEVLKLEP